MPSLVNLLKDVDVQAISLVEDGANGSRIFLYKCEGFACAGGVNELPPTRILKADESWSAFYIVVAEPGREEKPGMFGDQSTVDVWANEDEIRKAAWRFMENGALVNQMHKDMEPYGSVVENAVALDDFQVNDETIRKGSWYIAVVPSDEGRSKVASGAFRGVSIQGTGVREPMEKDAAFVPNKPGVTNWVERTGGLPKFIADIAGDLITERGKTTSNAIQMAVGIVQRWCRGQGNVKPDTRAKACAALAEWEAKRAASHAMAKEGDPETQEIAPEDEAWLEQRAGNVEDVERDGILRRIAKALGVDVDEPIDDSAYEELCKRTFTAEQRRNARFSMKGDSFPIDNCEDVKAAVSSIGRGNADPAAVKAHIIRAAKALNCTGQLPDSWGISKGLDDDSGTVEDMADLSERVESIEKQVTSHGERFDAIEKTLEPLGGLVEKIDNIGKKLEGESQPPETKPPAGDPPETVPPPATPPETPPTTPPTPDDLLNKIGELAEGQGTMADALVKVHEQVEKMAEESKRDDKGADGSRQVDQPDNVQKQNGGHPLAGLFS